MRHRKAAGTIERLASGSYRARWWGLLPDGRLTRVSQTFATREEALAHLGSLRQDRKVAPTVGTLRSRLADAEANGGERMHRWKTAIAFLKTSCIDLLDVPLDDEDATEALLRKVAARRTRRRAAPLDRLGRAPRLLTLRPGVGLRVRNGIVEAQFPDQQWEAFALRTRVANQRLAEVALGLASGQPVRVAAILPSSDASYGFHRTLVERGIAEPLSSSPQLTESIRTTSRKTRGETRALLKYLMGRRAHLVPPLERGGYDEGSNYIERRKRTALGLDEDLPYIPIAEIERVLLAIREIGAERSASPALQCLALIAATGLRSGEARALRWRHVQDKHLFVPGTKTSAARRTINLEPSSLGPISEGISAQLSSWRGESANDDYVFSQNDQPLTGDNLRKELITVNRRLQLTPAASRSGLWVHALRHFFAHSAIERGVSASALAAHLGHATILMTVRYGRPSGLLMP
jgi:integrase